MNREIQARRMYDSLVTRMILDSLSNAALYESLHPGFTAAFAFLRSPLARSLEPVSLGSENSLRHAIDFDRVFALIQRYFTKDPSETFWEAHRRHIDIQCVIEGAESMGCMPAASMEVMQRYDEVREFMKLEPKRGGGECPNRFIVSAGMFAIFFPSDAHMPSLVLPSDGKPAPVKKVVVKVRVSEGSAG